MSMGMWSSRPKQRAIHAGPEPWETGFKDTFIAYPGEVSRVKGRFDRAGRYVWHCHIVEHEDNEMMRPHNVVHEVFLPRVSKEGQG